MLWIRDVLFVCCARDLLKRPWKTDKREKTKRKTGFERRTGGIEGSAAAQAKAKPGIAAESVAGIKDKE